MDTSEPIPPLMVGEPYDLDFFATREAIAGGYLEPWFAETDYVAWDALARPLELVVVEPPPVSGGFIKRTIHGAAPSLDVRLRDTEPSEDCLAFLREWLVRVGGPAMPEDATLSDLLVQALIRGELHR